MDHSKRLLELAQIAYEVCALLDKRDVKQQEGCIVRRFAEYMWHYGNQDGPTQAVAAEQCGQQLRR